MRIRITLGVLLILAFQVGAYRALPGMASSYLLTHHDILVDEVTQYGRRFEGIRGQLPPRGPVGYRADDPVQEKDGTFFVYQIDRKLYPMDVKKSYLLAQYFLAPVIVDKTREYPRVLENRRDGVRLVPAGGE